MSKEDFLKDYIKVNDRILKFYETYPEGSIETEILLIDNEKVVMKALVYRNKDDTKPATGHAEEIRNSTYINRTSAVENCETSAVGRALANLGFEIRYSIASREEIERAIDKQEFLKESAPIVSEKQKKEIFEKAKQKGISTTALKNICEDITNKSSSKHWTSDDLAKISEYIHTIETH